MPVSEPATARGRATRARIVQAGAELVAERGAAAMSLDEVGARACASRSQLYHYFEDRDDLIRAIIHVTIDTVLADQDDLLSELDAWSGIDRWFATLEAVQRRRQARGGCPIGSLVGQLAERDPGARAALADGFDRWEGHLRDGLERMQADGCLASDAHPGQLATATMALLQGGLLLAQVARSSSKSISANPAVLRLVGVRRRPIGRLESCAIGAKHVTVGDPSDHPIVSVQHGKPFVICGGDGLRQRPPANRRRRDGAPHGRAVRHASHQRTRR